MAKETKFAIENGVATYTLDSDRAVSVDLNQAFGFNALTDAAKACITFSVKTAMRNCTAGKMSTPEGVVEAYEALKTRAETWLKGIWTARRESEAEPRSSLLARALAQVQGCEPSEAAEFINSMIDAALQSAGIDPEADGESLSDDEKKAKRKVQSSIRKEISDDPGVALALAQIKAQDAADKAKLAAESAQGQTSKFAK